MNNIKNRVNLAIGTTLLVMLSYITLDHHLNTPSDGLAIDGYTYSEANHWIPDLVSEPTDEDYFYMALEGTPYNERQVELLQIAYEEGQVVGWPETIQAILLQESSAGLYGPVGDTTERFGRRSYCHMQVKLAAARDVIRRYDLGSYTTDEELLVHLMTDDRFCIRVGAHYFKLMTEQTRTWNDAVVAYNRGVTGAQRTGDVGGYLKKVSARIQHEIRPYEELLTGEIYLIASR